MGIRPQVIKVFMRINPSQLKELTSATTRYSIRGQFMLDSISCLQSSFEQEPLLTLKLDKVDPRLEKLYKNQIKR